MLTLSEALGIAQESAREDGGEVREEDAHELSNGWFFRYVRRIEGMVGSQGVIVNKQSGACFELGSAFSADRDLWAYEAGYELDTYDIRLTKVHDHDSTLNFLENLGISVVEPEFAHGVT